MRLVVIVLVALAPFAHAAGSLASGNAAEPGWVAVTVALGEGLLSGTVTAHQSMTGLRGTYAFGFAPLVAGVLRPTFAYGGGAADAAAEAGAVGPDGYSSVEVDRAPGSAQVASGHSGRGEAVLVFWAAGDAESWSWTVTGTRATVVGVETGAGTFVRSVRDVDGAAVVAGATQGGARGGAGTAAFEAARGLVGAVHSAGDDVVLHRGPDGKEHVCRSVTAQAVATYTSLQNGCGFLDPTAGTHGFTLAGAGYGAAESDELLVTGADWAP